MNVYSCLKFSNTTHILMHHIVYGPFEMCLFQFYIYVVKNIQYRNLLLCVRVTLCDIAMNDLSVGDKRHGSHSLLQEGGKPTQSVGLQVHHYRLFLKLIRAGVHKFPNIWKPPQNSGYQNDDLKQVPY